MQKLLSILLLAAFALPLLAPALALGQDDQASLPACCRRNGKHHCTMTLSEQSQGAAADRRFRAPREQCPYCPATVSASHAESRHLPEPGQVAFAALLSHPAGSPQTESKRRIARDRSRQMRGPPSASSSLLVS